MNDDNLKSEIDSLLPKSLQQKTIEHPLHLLDNQADPETKPRVVLQKSIRTYESDVAESLATKRTSMFTMMSAENKKRNLAVASQQPDTDSSNLNKKLLMTIISVTFIVAGIGGGFYLYTKSPVAPQSGIVKKGKIPSIIEPNNQKIVSINNINTNQLVKQISALLISEKVDYRDINEMILTQSISSTTQIVSASDFMRKINSKIPDILSRTLTNQWMIGTYGDETGNFPFIILKTDFFQNAFAGMLNWESAMPDDFAILFNYNDKINELFTIHGKFQDRTILNRDIREFINNFGELILLYSFIDKDTLVITTSETTLKGIIEKVEKQALIRYN